MKKFTDRRLRDGLLNDFVDTPVKTIRCYEKKFYKRMD